jgi:NAD(P)-dependent dehydrogenase (short-subunit alcohol dehydrogenase family)
VPVWQQGAELAESKVVLITGAASGIGARIATGFLETGCRVHVCDAAEATVKAFARANPDIGASVIDIADPMAVEHLFDEIGARYGRLDVLVNNAGIAGPTAPVEAIDPEDWQRTIDVDLNGQFYCTRRAVPMLKAGGGGSIINISSNAAFFGFPLRAPYTACKWALIGLTKTLAMELGPHKIRVNAICPGSVSGPRIDGVIQRDAAERGRAPDEIRSIYARQSSMRLFVDADDVAAMALFLASDSGACISGQAIGVDGHTESLSNWLDD